MRTWPWVLLCCASLAAALGGLPASAARAAEDSNEPYRVRIVVDMAKNRLLTPVFREKVERQIADGLQAALGKLAKVEVAPPSADAPPARSDHRTYFVSIQYSGASYHVQTRMHDGVTGLSSPSARRDRTGDREYVARTAALLIERDLGLLGTVMSEPGDDRKVTVDLKGGGIAGADLSKWVKKGEVFALARVPGSGAGAVVPWTYVQVQSDAPENGRVVCTFHSRYKAPQVTGLRAVLLYTRPGPLRLRLREERPGRALATFAPPVTLQFRRHGFTGEDSTRLDLTTNGARDVATAQHGDRGRFDRLAFVSVLDGTVPRAQVPVPVTDAALTLLTVPPAGDTRGEDALQRYRSLVRNVQDAYLVQLQLFKEINELTVKADRRTEALTKVRTTLTRLRQDHDRLSKEREEVHEELGKLKIKSRPSLNAVDNRLKTIKAGEADLNKHVALLEKIEAEENDPKRKEWLIQEQRARLAEKNLDLGEAIAIYKKAPADQQTEALKKHLASLVKQWETQDEDHKKARAFIYREWPKLTTEELREKMKDARSAFETCKKNGDKLGPAKLLRGAEVHRQRMAKELEKLDPESQVDDEKPAQVLKELAPQLAKLATDVAAFLKEGRKEEEEE